MTHTETNPVAEAETTIRCALNALSNTDYGAARIWVKSALSWVRLANAERARLIERSSPTN